MSDIFLSYDPYDREEAHKLSVLFRRQGWTVWMAPPTPPPGVDYAEKVRREIRSAKVLVALWSSEASESATVRDDLERVVLALPVLVLLDKARMPPHAASVRSFDLSDWHGAPSHLRLQYLLRHIGYLLATSRSSAAPPVSVEEPTLSEIMESARRGIKEATDARPEGGKQFTGVFISYRRNEAAAYAGRLYDRLAAHFGREKVFFDHENVGWGEDFVEVITEAAGSCAVMIVLISRQWSRGEDTQAGHPDYVRLEVAKALGRRIRVIPILIQGASMPAPKDLHEDLAPLLRRNTLPLSDTRWERDVEDLIKNLEGFLKD